MALFLKTLFPGFNSLRFEEDHSWLYFATIDHARAALVTLNLTTNLYSVFSKDRISTPSKEGFSIAGTAAATAAKSTRQVAVKDGVIVVGVKNDAIISPNSKSPVERGHQQQKQQGQTGSPSRYAITGKKNNTGHPPTATSSANHQVSSTSSSPSPAESPSRAPPIDLFNLKPVNKGNWGDDTEDGEQLPQEYTPHTSDTNLHAHVGAAPFYPQGESYEAEKKTIEATASAEPDYQAEFYQQKGDYDENRVEYDEFDEEEDAYFDEYIPSQHQNTSPNRTIPIKPAPQEMAAPTGSPPEVARTSSLENQQEVTFFEAEVEPEEPISVVPASAYEELLVRFKRIEERFEGLAVKANSIKEAAAALGDEKIPENIRFLINDLI